MKVNVLWCICCFILFSCQHKQQIVNLTIEKGKGSVHTSDVFHQDGVLLNGQWSFSAKFSDLKYQKVPSVWTINPASKQVGTYTLRLQLPKKHPLLGIKLNLLSTAYELKINGEKKVVVGKIGTDINTTTPSYKNVIIPLHHVTDSLQISIKVANFHHYKGGVLNPIRIDDYKSLMTEHQNSSFVNGIVLGALFFGFLTYISLYLLMKSEKYFLFYALYTADVIVHLLCLFDRDLYQWIPNWTLVYKIELGTIFLGVLFKLFFYNEFFRDLLKQRIIKGLTYFILLQLLVLIFTPAPFFTYLNYIIPIDLLCVLTFVIVIFFKANREHREGALTVSFFNVLLLGLLFRENFVIDKQYHSFDYIHLFFVFYLLGVSVVLIKKITNSIQNEKVLSIRLKEVNQKLEKQNSGLEEIVKQRTEQLLSAEKESFELKLKNKNKDLEIISASNLIKQQFTKNLIHELASLQRSEGAIKAELKGLIVKLKAQLNLEEKQGLLQNSLDEVNSAFYERLAEKYPDLSKTEREICAYIKLNLSNKEIAELRQTSLNTINVTKSRLRKKLNLNRDEELEQFIHLL